MSDSFDGQSFGGGPDLPEYESRICQDCCLIHDGLSRIMDLVNDCGCTAKRTYDKVAVHSQCVDPWIKDDTLKICKNINDLRESLFAIFRKPPLRNSLDGFYGSVESNIWQGDEEQHLYKNAVFQNFPTWWTRCTRRIYMALSSFHEGEPATTDQIAKWVGCSQQQAIESVQSMLEARCVTVVDGAIREIV